MKKAFAVVCTLVLVSQLLVADENSGKPGKEKSSAAAISQAASADAAQKAVVHTEIQRDAAQTHLETMIDELHLEASL